MQFRENPTLPQHCPARQILSEFNDVPADIRARWDEEIEREQAAYEAQLALEEPLPPRVEATRHTLIFPLTWQQEQAAQERRRSNRAGDAFVALVAAIAIFTLLCWLKVTR